MLRREEKPLKKHADALAKFNENIKVLTELETPAARAGIGKLTGIVAEYRKQFETVSNAVRKEGYDEKSGLQGSLRASVHDIERSIGELKNAPLRWKCCSCGATRKTS